MPESTPVRFPSSFLTRADTLRMRLNSHPERFGHLGTRAALLRLACIRGLAILEAELVTVENGNRRAGEP